VRCVPRGIERLNLEASDRQLGLRKFDNLFRVDGESLTPKGIHLVLIDPFGTGQRPRRVNEVARSFGVDIDLGTTSSPITSSTRMIKMDMGHQNVLNILRLHTDLSHFALQCVLSRCRTGFNKDVTGWSFD